MTNKQHRDFIFHYKNFQLLTPRKNSVKSSYNDPDEVKIICAEFVKQTPPGDIHDILIARRKRGDVTEVPRIAEVVVMKKVVEEEEDELEKEERELMRQLAELKVKKAKKAIMNQLPELVNAVVAECELELAAFKAKTEEINKKIADAKCGLLDEEILAEAYKRSLVDKEVSKLTA